MDMNDIDNLTDLINNLKNKKYDLEIFNYKNLWKYKYTIFTIPKLIYAYFMLSM